MNATSLPTPTPTELAAIRARLQRRSWPNRHTPQKVATVSTSAKVVLLGGGLVLAVVGVIAGSSAVAGSAVSLFQAGLALTWWLDDRAARATDRAVLERVQAEGIRPTDGRRRRLGVLSAAVALLVGCAQLGTALFVASVLAPAPVAVLAPIGPLLLLGVHVILVRRDLRLPGVTGTPLLDAVDAALARAGVAGRIGLGAPFVITLLPFLSTLPDPPSRHPAAAAAVVAFVAGIAAFVVAPLVLRRERPLLEDPRLAVVTPATSWLAGSPATVHPSGGSPT